MSIVIFICRLTHHKALASPQQPRSFFIFASNPDNEQTHTLNCNNTVQLTIQLIFVSALVRFSCTENNCSFFQSSLVRQPRLCIGGFSVIMCYVSTKIRVKSVNQVLARCSRLSVIYTVCNPYYYPGLHHTHLKIRAIAWFACTNNTSRRTNGQLVRGPRVKSDAMNPTRRLYMGCDGKTYYTSSPCRMLLVGLHKQEDDGSNWRTIYTPYRICRIHEHGTNELWWTQMETDVTFSLFIYQSQKPNAIACGHDRPMRNQNTPKIHLKMVNRF